MKMNISKVGPKDFTRSSINSMQISVILSYNCFALATLIFKFVLLFRKDENTHQNKKNVRKKV